MTVKVRKETLADGKTVRWRAYGVSAGKDPVTGKRRQRTLTAGTKEELEAEIARITGRVADGTYVPRWDGTVAEVVDAYEKSALFEKAANTRVSYRNALLPARERLGNRKARSITRQDIEQLRDWMLAEGRRRGGKPGTGLGARSVRLTLGRLSAAFEQACQDGRLAANPCRYVKLPSQVPREDTTWSEGQLKEFLAMAAGTRLAGCWLLSSLGLRRGEVLGLKWCDVDLDAGTLTIARTRVLVDGKVIVKSPKSRRSWRTLPLFEPVTSVLIALQTRQHEEMEQSGAAYVNSGFVCADELGRPLHPEAYSDEFGRLCRGALLPRIRLHDCRATMNAILEQAGVPDSLRACWLGHTVVVNLKHYTPKPKDLTPVSDMIGQLFSADVSGM
jgi:integrase